MSQNMLGIIDTTINEESLNELTNSRSFAAVPFGGRYRMIDFMLSNMVNSDVRSVAILTGAKTRALIDHLSSGKPWDLDCKRDGVTLTGTKDNPYIIGKGTVKGELSYS